MPDDVLRDKSLNSGLKWYTMVPVTKGLVCIITSNDRYSRLITVIVHDATYVATYGLPFYSE